MGTLGSMEREGAARRDDLHRKGTTPRGRRPLALARPQRTAGTAPRVIESARKATACRGTLFLLPPLFPSLAFLFLFLIFALFFRRFLYSLLRSIPSARTRGELPFPSLRTLHILPLPYQVLLDSPLLPPPVYSVSLFLSVIKYICLYASVRAGARASTSTRVLIIGSFRCEIADTLKVLLNKMPCR